MPVRAPAPWRRTFAAVALSVAATAPAAAQSGRRAAGDWSGDPPSLAALVDAARVESDLRLAVDRYLLDKAAIERRYPVAFSPVRQARLKRFHEAWKQRLADTDFTALNGEGRIDYLLLRNRIAYDLEMLAVADRRWAEIAPLVPFFDDLRLLQEQRFDRKRADGRATATLLSDTADRVTELTKTLAADAPKGGGRATRPGVTPVIAARAATQVDALVTMLGDWYAFYDGYDPVFSWWTREPQARLAKELGRYAEAVRMHLAGIEPGEPPPIIGDPLLADGLRADLAFEMIPYSPEELIAIGTKEFDGIEAECKKVARDMGFGDDWKAALEHVKGLAPPPGEKPWVIFDIASYSEAFVDRMDALTIPPLAREIWRLQMQTAERQRVNPFFTGGEVTRVSYPTEAMSHAEKEMSMRGNTPSFNFATVHHELIPGHHLQSFVNARFNTHRSRLQRTPFWHEGWGLYWELLLWDRDFPRDDADRVGMLFWRLHRAARIVFSLNYHLGRWSPQQAIDFLVERVGHERANAEGEVRRTTIDAPLYQVAYMVGGLQLRALARELVDSKKMTLAEFHDRVLRGGHMPIELVRARLGGQAVTPGMQSTWRFYDAAR
jgi:uncharacterized protein (DUF885 family)